MTEAEATAQLPHGLEHFRARFVEVGRERLQRCLGFIPSDDHFVWQLLATELYTLGAEAAMLGLTALCDDAHQAEQEARTVAISESLSVIETHRPSLRSRIGALRCAVEASSRSPAH